MDIEYESTVERWPGSVWMPEYMNFPSLVQWEDALSSTRALGEDATLTQFYNSLLPTAISFVKKWEIVGLPPEGDAEVTYDNFPASPKLCAWLVETISQVYKRTNEPDPKLPEPA